MKYIFLLLSIFINPLCYSQSRPAGPIVATPNAASLGLYGEVPVSYFTGLPNIEIPIYTIQERGLSFPITMSYHALGFKPDVHPSWVGANWSLNFGGAITRKMNKLPDEWNSNEYIHIYDNIFGYYYTHNRLNNFNWSSNDTLLAMGIANGNNNEQRKLQTSDREPDEFNFNFLGFSGKFYLDHLGNWRVQSNKNLRVVCDEADIIYPFFHNTVPGGSAFFHTKAFGKFTLIDDAGIKYVFGKTGGTDAIEYSSSITPPQFNYRAWLIATSWYLAAIEFPDQTGSISISYVRGPFQSNFQYFESDNRFFVSRCDYPSSVQAKGLSGTITSPVYPTSISTSSGITVDFKFSKSNELSYPTSTYFEVFRDEFGRLPSQLAPPQGIPLDYFNFMWAWSEVPYYVQNGIWADGIISSNKFAWFKLDSLVVSNWDINNNMAKSAFKRVAFNYRENINERLKLLSMNFKGSEQGMESQDYSFKYNDWGAGAPAYVTDLTDHWGFANNKPLKRDPTYGGYLWFGGNMLTNRVQDETSTKMDILTEITYPTGGKSAFEYEPNAYGKYLMVNTRSYAPTGVGIAGGLRIKKITNSDGLGNTDTKEFFYVNGYNPSVPLSSLPSSGILDGKPGYSNYNYSLSINGMYLSLYASNAIVPMSANSGSLCGYSEVAEKFKDGSYKVYKFTNHDNGYVDYDAIANITPYELGVPYRSRSFERGKLLSEDIFSANNNLVQKTEYTYVRIGAGADSNFVRSLRKEFGGYCTTVLPPTICPYIGQVAMGFQVPMINGFYIDPVSFLPTYTTATAYGYYVYKFLPEKITKKIYPSVGQTNQLLITETTNQYDQFGNVIQTIQNDSKGAVISNNFKYPYHFTGTAVYDAMISRNMKGMVIESESYRGANLIGKEKINYDFFNTGILIKPSNITKQVATNPSFVSMQFNRYDEYGNILELQNTDEVKNSFVWSYFKSRPVAKVIGSDYATIQPIINQQVLNYPSQGDAQLLAEVDKLRTQLPSSHVTTYLYDSKSDWGVKQVKDPNGLNIFYEYDAMGRLARVRDNNNKILSQNEYKYKDVVFFPYRNVEKSQAFNKTNCQPGYAGGATYIVLADKFGSFINQLDADQKALNDIAANGQAYVNSTAVCYPYWSYTSCCGFGCVYSDFALTGTGSVNFSLIITKNPPGGGSGLRIGTLSGLLFIPSANRNISFSSGGSGGMITIATNGDVMLSGSVGNVPLYISGTYSL